MIAAATFARQNNIPFLGLCLGLQIMIIEFARNVAGIPDATSSEFNASAANPVIDLMESQRNVSESGGTMRLGIYDCNIVPGTVAHQAYANSSDSAPQESDNSLTVQERHRHRYEYNNDYADLLVDYGLVSSGVNPKLNLVEIAEVAGHPFMLGSQFHPEFRSRPDSPHPMFNEFVLVASQSTPIEGQPSLITSDETAPALTISV